MNAPNSIPQMTGGVIELDFTDGSPEILVDPIVTLVDPCLKRLHLWWTQLQANGGNVPWNDRYLDDLSFVRDALHLHEIAGDGAIFKIRFAGQGLIDSLGEDFTGRWISPETPIPEALRTVIARIRELLKIEVQMKAPLRTYSKSPYAMPVGQFTIETLCLPFRTDGTRVDFVLAASILTRATGQP